MILKMESAPSQSAVVLGMGAQASRHPKPTSAQAIRPGVQTPGEVYAATPSTAWSSSESLLTLTLVSSWTAHPTRSSMLRRTRPAISPTLIMELFIGGQLTNSRHLLLQDSIAALAFLVW